jgi:hypothetical protein
MREGLSIKLGSFTCRKEEKCLLLIPTANVRKGCSRYCHFIMNVQEKSPGIHNPSLNSQNNWDLWLTRKVFLGPFTSCPIYKRPESTCKAVTSILPNICTWGSWGLITPCSWHVPFYSTWGWPRLLQLGLRRLRSHKQEIHIRPKVIPRKVRWNLSAWIHSAAFANRL